MPCAIMRSTRILTSRSLSSSSSHQMTDGRLDFRFGLCEIGALSSLLCWFCGLGCGEAAARKRLRLGPPASGPKNPRRFWGAPRPRNEKPGAVSRAGLGHTPEGYLFIHESRFNVQKSQVASHKLHRSHKLHHAKVVFGIPRTSRPHAEPGASRARSIILAACASATQHVICKGRSIGIGTANRIYGASRSN